MIRRIAITLGALGALAGPAAAQHDDHGAADQHAAAAGQQADQEHAAGIDHATTVEGHGEGHGAAGHGAHHGPPPINWLDFGYAKKDVHGGELDPGDEPMAPPLLAALFNFAVFGFLIVKFGGPKVSAYLRTRHDTIKHDLAEAARLRAEAASKLAEYSTRVAKVNAEVDALIGEIRAEADAEKARILADARAQAEALKKDADDRIASEFARARIELEQEIVAAAVSAAERILRERTTPADQTALFDGFVASLSSPRPAGGTRPSPGSTNPPPSADEGWT